MKRIAVLATIAAALAAPAAASADPSSKADKREARSECRALLDAAGDRSNLGRLFGTNRAEAFKTCVRSQTRDAHRERHAARRAARATCREEHEPGTSAFRECVAEERSENASALDAHDAERLQAVRQCAESTETGREFGRCVARAMANENGQQGLDHADQGSGNAEQGDGAENGSTGEQFAEQGEDNSQVADPFRPDGVPPGS